MNGGTIPVYSRSDCPASAHSGDLYYGEVFTDLGVTTGYTNVHEIRYLNPSGQYVGGFIQDTGYGNLMYSGTLQNMTSLGTCYAFRLRRNLSIVNNYNGYHLTLGAGTLYIQLLEQPAQQILRTWKLLGTTIMEILYSIMDL